ncbi:signal peptidase I [Marinihelvus fidelis]|uniref:Signal peptidase I n=1 Tax=Marinihelvus fidelis TaxID=2613842 RepID=A0A5N0TG74_9GAMM|nr:signal peptidase I [Marinihelvus fidelis]KAA9134085.1 signal peptidase I [Marinihelvus fidelis]
MNLDFALVLVVLTLLTGLIWLADHLFFRARRIQRAERAGKIEVNEPAAVEYSRSLFPVLFAVLIFRSFLFEPFKIPSGSMIPTLLVGDFIVVNKFNYGLRLPVLNNKFVPIGDPERGDVIVFRHPAEPGVTLVKRLVGLPGDRVVYRNKQLTINGEVMTIQGGAPLASGDLKCSTPRRDAVRYREDLGGKRHDILLHTGMRGPEGEWVVPEGHYFMMGDNRDQSVDSRSWGFAPEENIMGRAVATWLNFDFNQGCADWGRVGEGIE